VFWTISFTKRPNGAFGIKRLWLFWYWRISRSATVPVLYLLGFFSPPFPGVLRLLATAFFTPGCLGGAVLRAVFFVLAILLLSTYLKSTYSVFKFCLKWKEILILLLYLLALFYFFFDKINFLQFIIVDF
jgi:hypothetical protein